MTLHSGQGSGMGIAGAELLARLLAEHGPPARRPRRVGATAAPVRHLPPEGALRMRHLFMPAHRFGHAARRTLIRAANIPVGSELTKTLVN
ncbi:hypothetical protein ABT009_47225 [Streptomyces sp. NPDC002896]|uniref:hypothetical protein n=1 Tax=Streptomyces sp. NPDC002896 TaxID=3154438 RepID=UPI00332CBA50